MPGLLLLATHLSTAEDPSPAKPSTYAPAADLENQVDFYLGRLSDSLASQAEFDLAKQSRVYKDANTLAAILLVLGLHDQPNKYRDSATAAIMSAHALSAGAEDYAVARKSLDALKASVGAGKGDKLDWSDVADLASLMKQVPVVHASLKRRSNRPASKSKVPRWPDRRPRWRQSPRPQPLTPAPWPTRPTPASGNSFARDARCRRSPQRGRSCREPHSRQRGQQALLRSCDTCHATFRQ